MIQDLVEASRKMASLYRYGYVKPSHLLYAISSTDRGKTMMSMEGFDVPVLRSTMIREFKAHFVATEQPSGDLQVSRLFEKCCDAYAASADEAGPDEGLRAAFKLIYQVRDHDSVTDTSLDEADMKKSIGEPEFIPGLDDIFEEENRDDDMSVSLRKPGEQSPPLSWGTSPSRHARTRIDPPEESSRQEDGKSRIEQKLTKEMEETRAAVSASQRDLTALARNGELDPVIGRDPEIDRVIEVLLRRRKPNVILVAEPGVGKTALVEGVANKIVSPACPDETLSKRPIREVSLSSMVAGSRYRGDFESRMNFLVAEAVGDNAILFIDEIHMLTGSGSVTKGGMDGANILKPALARDGLSLIGATTPDEISALKDDRALMRRFEIIRIEEPLRDDMKIILLGAAEPFLQKHGVGMKDAMIERLLEFAERYLVHRRDPDRSFDLLDLAAVSARMAGRADIEEEDLRHATFRLGGSIPARRSRSESTEELAAFLLSRVKGQRDGVACLADRVSARMRRGGMDGVIAISGPNGIGKTHAARSVAAFYRKRPVEFSVDMSLPGSLMAMRDGMMRAFEMDSSSILIVKGNDGLSHEINRCLSDACQSDVPSCHQRPGSLVIYLEDLSDRASPGFGRDRRSEDHDDTAVRFVPFDAEALIDILDVALSEGKAIMRDAGMIIPASITPETLPKRLTRAPGTTYSEVRDAVLEYLSEFCRDGEIG